MREMSKIKSSIELNSKNRDWRRSPLLGPGAPGKADELRALLQLADQLSHLDVSHESRIRRQLRIRLLTQAEQQPSWAGWSLAAVRPQPLLAWLSVGLLLFVGVALAPTTAPTPVWPGVLENQPSLVGPATMHLFLTQQPLLAGNGVNTTPGQLPAPVEVVQARQPTLIPFEASDSPFAPTITPGMSEVGRGVEMPTPAPAPPPSG
ncbi:MAG: hypothetical protein DCC55_10425 [Chloroflexi bacterium]|nr:MAG: hypothetical protein DCC55_10425 [Chloroflexota bacterium]